jgi:hypothetical protein
VYLPLRPRGSASGLVSNFFWAWERPSGAWLLFDKDSSSAANYWLNRKNCCVPEMGLVTTFWSLRTTGAGGKQASKTVDNLTSVVDCRAYPA